MCHSFRFHRRGDMMICVVVLPSWWFHRFMFLFVWVFLIVGEIHRVENLIVTLVLPSLNRNTEFIGRSYSRYMSGRFTGEKRFKLSFSPLLFFGFLHPVLFHVGEITQGSIFQHSRSPLWFMHFSVFDHFDHFAYWGPRWDGDIT